MMELKVWTPTFSGFVLGAGFVLGMASFADSSLAFQLSSKDGRFEAAVGQIPTVSISSSGISYMDPAFDGEKAKFQQAQNSGRSPVAPVAKAPPLRLQPRGYSLTAPSPPPSRAPVTAPVTVPPPAAKATPPSFSSRGGAPSPGAPSPGASSIVGVRLGKHPGMTRVVFDLSAKVDYAYVISKTGTAVAVSFTGVGWRAGAASQRGKGVVSDYSFTKDQFGDGLFTLNANVPVKIKRVFSLLPSGGRGYRVILDLTSARSNASAGEMTMATNWRQGFWPR